jgi:ABC-type transport system involved in multi-copper enzyme maturation permease subunit
MTATEIAPGYAARRAPRRGNPWRPSFHGVALVTRIELLRRRPSSKGYIAYGVMLAVIIGLGILVSAMSPQGKDSTPMELVLILVLGAGVLIGPSLSATSINGDSGEGVLAPLQMTHLTAGDLAIGKLLASWLFSVAVLVTTTPFLVYAFSRSGWHWDELLLVLAVILLVVLTSSAIGLAWSAIAARSVASVSLAHLTTGSLVLGSLVLYAFSGALVSETVVQKDRYIDWQQLSAEQQTAIDAGYMSGDFSDVDVDSLVCADQSYEYGVAHTEKTAWLLLINPGIMIGEFSPIVSPTTFVDDGRAGPGLFAQIHGWVSAARIGPSAEDLQSRSYDECANIAAMAAGAEPDYGDDGQDWEALQEERATYERAPWLGLGLQGALLVGSMIIVVRRLRVPYKKLRVGTRVA